VRARTVGRHRAPGGLLDSGGLPSLDLDGGLASGSDVLGGGLGLDAGGALSSGTPAGVATPSLSDDSLHLVRTRVPQAVARLRDFYRLIMLLAFIGVAVLLARRRTRLT
jgi:hypothetical protein